MKKTFLPSFFLLLLTTLFSCNNREISTTEVDLKGAIESDVLVRDLKITPVSSLRSGEIKKDVISFKDEVSGEEYCYSITENSEGSFYLTFENNGTIDNMTLRVLSETNDNYVITAEYQERNLITGVQYKNLENGGVIFELNDDFNKNLRTVYYESWWDCVKRLALCEESAMIGILTRGKASLAIAGAAGIICLRQSERKIHHIDDSPGEIRPM